MKCHDIRAILALDPTIADAEVQAHVAACAGCARYRRQHHTIDVALRAELRWEAPDTLTARLVTKIGPRATRGA